MITYPKLAAAIVELHNNIAGSFAAPQQARATTETPLFNVLNSISRMADDMREDARERLRAHNKSSAAAASFAEDVVNLYALLRLQDAIPIQMVQVINEIYFEALKYINSGREVDPFIAYEEEVPF